MYLNRALVSAVIAGAVVLTAGCTGRTASDVTESDGTFSATTSPAVGESGPTTWAVYRATNSLDPIRAFDTPESLPITAMCETLLQQQADLSIKPGLAESADYVDDTTLVLELRDDARFWDGSPVTAEDVVYSLERARDPELGGFFSTDFSRVSSISASAANEVTISLSEPDFWLRSALSAMPGVVMQKQFSETAGAAVGTPGTGVMCSGAFTFASWNAGGEVLVERNDDYWNADRTALVPSVTFTPVSNDANLAAAFTTGDIDGYYIVGSSVFEELQRNPTVTVTSGPSFVTDLLAVSDPDGPLGDQRVRQALSLAIDRNSYIQQVYFGQAGQPSTMSNPGTWGYGKDVFAEAAESSPRLNQDLETARNLVAEAGAEGQSVTMAVAAGIATFEVMGAVVKEALESIGLEINLQTVALDKYNELYFDPAAREGIDVFPSINNPIAPEPAPFLAGMAAPDAPYNFLGWRSDDVTALLDLSRLTADDEERARLVAEADRLITAGLPQIPLAHPYSVLYLNSDLTGPPASYSFAAGEWANLIGKAAE